MTLLYGLIAKSDFGEWSTISQNPANRQYKFAVESALQRVPSDSSSQLVLRSFETADTSIHVRATPHLCYAILCHKHTPSRVAFGCLEAIETDYERRNQPRDASNIIREKIAYSNLHGDKIATARGHIDDIKVEIMNNIDRLLDNQEQLDRLDDSTNQLAGSAFQFSSKSKKLKNRQFLYIIALLCILFIICCCVFTVIIVFFLIIYFSISEGTKKKDENSARALSSVINYLLW